MVKWFRVLIVPLALFQASPLARAQQPAEMAAPAAAAAAVYTQAELEQILAPIALYPDDLLTQVLIAATYPLEVVLANRWLQQPGHKDLKGDALVQALGAQDWDASVKSIAPFPAVLKTMSDQLDWTQKLGNAFLAQQSDVFAAVQTLRGRAKALGTLQSNAQQTVTQEAAAIVIQPAQPDTVYIPTYNPTVVYGAWPNPAYPPTYYPPPPGYAVGSALATGLAFGTGIAITSALWGWGRPNWSNGGVNVNVNRFNSINSNQVNNLRSNRATTSSDVWKHNADHRRGVPYSNNQVRQQFRPNQATNAASRDAFRGRPSGAVPGLRQPGQGPGGGGLASRGPNASTGAGTRAGAGAGAGLKGGLAERRATGGAAGGNPPGRSHDVQRPDRRGQPPARAQSVRPANGGAANRGRQQATPRAAGGSQAFKGVGNGAATRAQASQGRASRAGMARSGGGQAVHRGGRH